MVAWLPRRRQSVGPINCRPNRFEVKFVTLCNASEEHSLAHSFEVTMVV